MRTCLPFTEVVARLLWEGALDHGKPSHSAHNVELFLFLFAATEIRSSAFAIIVV
jgi:hypothetical protein